MRDVNIGYNNLTVLSDLNQEDLHGVFYRLKPQVSGGIRRNNPSDIIIELDDGTFTGYSNKIGVGKDATQN